jgi:hypothetical protein
MKKIFIAMFCTIAFANLSVAQTNEAPTMSKEEKAKQKAKQAEEMAAAYKAAGLSDEETTKIAVINDEANKKNAELRKDASLTDEARKEKIKSVNDEKMTKIKDLMGKDRYKMFSEMRKKQKADAEAAAAASKQ